MIIVSAAPNVAADFEEEPSMESPNSADRTLEWGLLALVFLKVFADRLEGWTELAETTGRLF